LLKQNPRCDQSRLGTGKQDDTIGLEKDVSDVVASVILVRTASGSQSRSNLVDVHNIGLAIGIVIVQAAGINRHLIPTASDILNEDTRVHVYEAMLF